MPRVGPPGSARRRPRLHVSGGDDGEADSAAAHAAKLGINRRRGEADSAAAHAAKLGINRRRRDARDM